VSARRAAVSRSGRPRPSGEDGQATLEVALALPVLLLLLVLVASVGRLGHDAVALAHAAREAARAVAVDAGPEVARAAALRGGALDGDRLMVRVGHRGGPGSVVEVELEYRVPVSPVFADRVPPAVLTGRAAARVER
jgi:hypothetical protein